MAVNVNGVPFEENNSEELLDEFYVFDYIKGLMRSTLPADISYFYHNKIDSIFRELDNNPESKPEDYAYVLSSIVVNIGNAARQPSSLEKCYHANIRYKGTVLYYFNKYKNKLSEAGRTKVRHSVEHQFKHFEFNPLKIALRTIKINKVPLARIPAMKVLKIAPKPIASTLAQTTNTLVGVYSGWLAVKYYDLLEAVRVYKRAMYTDYDIEDVKSIYISKAIQQESEYFYNMALHILEDMLKVYDQL